MDNMTAIAPMPTRKIFSLLVLAFFILWMIVCVLVYQAFGLGAAIGLSFILAFPAIIALRIRKRWHTVKKNELWLLSVLSAVALLAVFFLIWKSYDLGMDIRYAEKMRLADFRQLLCEDPAFNDVEVFVSAKDIIWLHGTVTSEKDIERLDSLAKEHNLSVSSKVEVRK